MSQRQRRRKKHRGGTQAGTVRKPTRRSRTTRANLTPAQRRQERLERPPSWRAAANRAAISSAVFFAVLVLLLDQKTGNAIVLSAFMLLVYIPMGYGIDSVVYRMRQRRKQRQQSES